MQTETRQLRELTLRYSVKKSDTGEPLMVPVAVATPAQSAAIVMPLLQHEANEVFAILCLSTKHRVVAYHEVSRGTLDATLVHPRDVFKAALLANSAAIVIAHVHPSGDPTPSLNDILLTRRLVTAGELLGVDVLDHIIVGDGRYYSFRQGGQL
ncbi:MAG: DNA repair protein RadC [Luteitalea sp.]|nr:DNA repair protein RadC [Luteitalea sp.]